MKRDFQDVLEIHEGLDLIDWSSSSLYQGFLNRLDLRRVKSFTV